MADIAIKLYPRAYYRGTKNLDGAPYEIKISWSTYSQKHYLSIASLANRDVVIRGIPLLCGRDLLAPYGYGHLLGSLRLVDTSGANEDPGFAGLGDRWKLFYTPRAA